MIFVRSLNGGVSHSPDELSSPEDVALGVDALERTLRRLATGLMPLQNRVTPLGELIAVPERGLVYGNRGCLHDGEGRIRRNHATRRWIACRLSFKGWHREPLLQPGKFTELFFLDEATAFAAGHRPCALCRREDYNRFGELWRGETGADAIDALLHAERLDGRGRRLHDADLGELPDGAFVLREGEPWLVFGDDSCAGRPAATASGCRGHTGRPRSSRRRRSSRSSLQAGPRTYRSCIRPRALRRR